MDCSGLCCWNTTLSHRVQASPAGPRDDILPPATRTQSPGTPPPRTLCTSFCISPLLAALYLPATAFTHHFRCLPPATLPACMPAPACLPLPPATCLPPSPFSCLFRLPLPPGTCLQDYKHLTHSPAACKLGTRHTRCQEHCLLQMGCHHYTCTAAS